MADYYTESMESAELERAIDEDRANFYGTGVRPRGTRRHLDSNTRRRYGVVDTGGVYLPPAKGTIYMHPAQTPSPDPERELQCALELQQTLADRIDYLQDIVKHKPAEPRRERISVSVKYNRKGKSYEFLLVRTPDKRWFSTGTKPGTQEFRDWNAVTNWLMSGDIYSFFITELQPVPDVPF
ncbi:hypothetical protein WILDE_68 [Arthrobacter phage Wilde]|uniref:Uncharacterized protein n=1 Tax=Arthrobacter phage Wilde TaxID=1772323 RepID=A0A0U4KC02_9CAUD|nr:hypothetical protein WILDE_68 [Arthrobacter phage Wilde]